MPVKQFLKRNKDPNSKLDGKNVHPMNVIDIPLDYIDRESGGSKCGSVVKLPTEVMENSLGHRYQKFLGGDLDLVSAHSKYLLLSEATSYTEPHEDMSGSNVFYALLTGEKIFHVYLRDSQLTEAIRTLTPEEFDTLLESHHHYTVRVHAGEGLLMPGNLVHRVYTIQDSVAIGCNFIAKPQIENCLSTRQWECEKVDQELSKPANERELKQTNLFYNFEAIAAIFLFEKLQHHRRFSRTNRSRWAEDAELVKFKRLINLLEILKRDDAKVAGFKELLANIRREWVKPGVRKFNWDEVEFFSTTGAFM